MPRPVVVHHCEQRQFVMGRRPQDARRVVHVAIGLDVHDNSPSMLRGKSGAARCTGAVTHTAGTLAAEVAIWLVVFPQLAVMTT